MNEPFVDSAPLARPCVLLVEDEIFIRIDTAEVLRANGFDVLEAGSASEALKLVATGHKIDALFTDIRMPGEMDGLQLADELERRVPGVPIIVTSGNYRALDGVIKNRPFFVKPYDSDAVAALIVKAVSSRSHSAASGSPA